MPLFNLKINGESHSVNVDGDTPILWVLRDNLNLVGTKYGCGIAQCGACTIHVDGQAVRSCIFSVSNAENKDITTIEGLSSDLKHPIQQAWIEHDVPQCGYCQSGQMMQAASLLSNVTNPSDDEIRENMNGNICRCGTYNRINAAIKTASKRI